MRSCLCRNVLKNVEVSRGIELLSVRFPGQIYRLFPDLLPPVGPTSMFAAGSWTKSVTKSVISLHFNGIHTNICTNLDQMVSVSKDRSSLMVDYFISDVRF